MPPRTKKAPDAEPTETAPVVPEALTTGATGETFWERLTSPFPVSWIEKLPKNLKSKDENRGRCENTPTGRFYSADGTFCGGWHAKSVHLDYIGHAGITMRLNEVCTPAGWRWTPMAETDDGFPVIGRDEFWIWLGIKDPETGEWVEKQGVGDDYRGSKVAVGDALRNAAMRFGIGTYLWSKSDHAAALAGVGQTDAPTTEQQGTVKPGATEVYEAVKDGWHDYERLRVLREDVVQFGYELVKVQGPEGMVSLLELVEQRGLELAAARQQSEAAKPPAADPPTETQPPSEVDRIREAARAQGLPVDDADAAAAAEHAQES